MKHKMRMPDLMESIFDIGYLVFDLIAGILFLIYSNHNALFILYGILTLTLCFGDAFHLIPRIKKAIIGTNEKIQYELGLGLQISSITMTIFYIMLLYIWKLTFNSLSSPICIDLLIWITGIVRIVICLLPQNGWTTNQKNSTLSFIRNSVFLVTGLCIVYLYYISGNLYNFHLYRMCFAIIVSFACYMPVTIYSKKYPMIGMLMIPKTISYIWMIVMGLQLLF